MKKNPYVSVVIPTFNEERNIKKVLLGVKNVLKNYKHEIIIVDNHSIDKTVQVARSLRVSVIFDNKGKGSALEKGFNMAKGDIVISMDADLSNRPKELRLLIAGIETGYDICIGSRFMSGGGSGDMPFIRKFGNKFFVFVVNHLYGSKYTDMCYGYRSFAKGISKKLNLKEKGFGIETEINIKAKKLGLKVLEVPSYEKPRAAGEAKLRSLRDGYIILRTILKNL